MRFLLLAIFCVCVSFVFAQQNAEKNAEKTEIPPSCTEAVQTKRKSGMYQIQLSAESKPFYVYCEISDKDKVYTIIQRRNDSTTSFNRTWADYKNGFGNIAHNHFIGLDKLHEITQTKLHRLWIRLESWEHEVKYAEYTPFTIGNEDQGYAITVLGHYFGTAGDSLRYHADSKFTTFDKDNDESELENCAQIYSSGWWFKKCIRSNLNGLYYKGKYSSAASDGVVWQTFRGLEYSHKIVQMAVRPIDDSLNV